MGMYSQLKLNVDLEYNVELLTVLKYMADTSLFEGYSVDKPIQPLIDAGVNLDYPLFKTQRWSHMITGNHDMFDGNYDPVIEIIDHWGKKYIHFECCFDLKDYDDECKCFLNYLEPYITNDKEFIGHYWYEEDSNPVPIWIEKHKIEFCGNFSRELIETLDKAKAYYNILGRNNIQKTIDQVIKEANSIEEYE